MITKTLPPFRTRALPALALALLASFAAPVPARCALNENVAEPRSASVPMTQVGDVASQQYHGDGLSVTPTANGARLRCDFQRLEGEATAEGLWLNSTITDKSSLGFRITAATVGRVVAQTLPSTGAVTVTGQTVRFVRSGLVEEYTVSIDGVRQDFVMAKRPADGGESVCAGGIKQLPLRRWKLKICRRKSCPRRGPGGFGRCTRLQSDHQQAFAGRCNAVVVRWLSRHQLRAGARLQPGNTRLDSTSDQYRRCQWRNSIHQYTRARYQQFLAHPLCALTRLPLEACASVGRYVGRRA